VVKKYSQFLIVAMMFFSGCSTYGVIDNKPLEKTSQESTQYSVKEWIKVDSNSELDLNLTLSGGGTRAAAFSYGVLKGLRDTTIDVDGKSVRLLDEIDQISSVSGGSFTAAYYGLNGDGIFDTFEEAFLFRDVQSSLFWGLANPVEWFRDGGRTEMAVRFYDKHVFHDATFSDIKKDGPLIIVNASGLGNGVRFSFIQEYFNFICSDISDFSVSKAVTASSSVPVLFLPVVLEKYPECDFPEPEWLKEAKVKAEKTEDPMLNETIRGLEILSNKDELKYIHLVDGGITDNLGLHAMYDIVTAGGGAKKALDVLNKKPPKYFVIISVNASTNPIRKMDVSNEKPSISETLDAMSSAQLHRYNSTTIGLMEESIKKWAQEISTPEQQVKTYFINIGLEDHVDPEVKLFFNKIPTSFGLSEETVNRLVNGGIELLHKNAEYQRLVSDLKGSIDTQK
jgi:NTE family protein